MTGILQWLRADYCTCHAGYKTRGMLDPACESCSTKDDRAEAADEIERLRDGASRWIPVTERLPSQGKRCWLTVGEAASTVWRGYLDVRGEWRCSSNGSTIPGIVIAWQPITKPEAYKP